MILKRKTTTGVSPEIVRVVWLEVFALCGGGGPHNEHLCPHLHNMDKSLNLRLLDTFWNVF